MKTIEEIKIHLREEVLKAIKEKGLSQGKLADRLGVDRRVVNRTLNAGFESTSIHKLVQMLLVMEVEVYISTRP